MKFARIILGLSLTPLCTPGLADDKKPPYHGTIFINGDIVTEKDESVFERLEAKGVDKRRMFDRRVNTFIENEPFLFDAYYSDGLKIEIQVNSEF
ncbi:MAG: hypothetical protein MUC83_18280, partial [Pirellula sp.]|nr:hypothetical protein [Pirellula sp.]